MDMEHETFVGRSENPVVEGDLVHPVGCSEAEHAARGLCRSSRIQSQETIPHPGDASRPMQYHDQEVPEHDLSRMTATHDSHDPENNRGTVLRVAIAPRHPQITHAHATSCPMCTCAHRRWP